MPLFPTLLAISIAAVSADLPAGGWTFVASSEGASIYMKRVLDHRGQHLRVWTAYDLSEAREREGFLFRSVKSLSEYDCATRRARVIGETFHAEAGLAGREWAPKSFEPTDWDEPVEGSVGDLRMEFVCPRPNV